MGHFLTMCNGHMLHYGAYVIALRKPELPYAHESRKSATRNSRIARICEGQNILVTADREWNVIFTKVNDVRTRCISTRTPTT